MFLYFSSNRTNFSRGGRTRRMRELPCLKTLLTFFFLIYNSLLSHFLSISLSLSLSLNSFAFSGALIILPRWASLKQVLLICFFLHPLSFFSFHFFLSLSICLSFLKLLRNLISHLLIYTLLSIPPKNSFHPFGFLPSRILSSVVVVILEVRKRRLLVMAQRRTFTIPTTIH